MFKICGKFISFKKVTTGIKKSKIDIKIENLFCVIINYKALSNLDNDAKIP